MPLSKNTYSPEGNALRDAESTEVLGRIRDMAIGAAKAVTTDIPGAVLDFVDRLSTRTGPEGGYSNKIFESVTGIKSSGSTQELVGSVLNPEAALKSMIVGAARLSARTGARNMEKVQELSQNFASNQELFSKTGVYADADNKFKAVISDAGAKLDRDAFVKTNTGRVELHSDMDSSTVLDDILYNHTTLYQTYPELSTLKIKSMPDAGVGEANFNSNTWTINLGPQKTLEDARSVILHEVQHAVQAVEDFTRGSNLSKTTSPLAYKAGEALKAKRAEVVKRGDSAELDAFDRYVNKIKEERMRGFNAYLNVPGEQEARYTQATKDMGNMEINANILHLLKQGKNPQNWDTRDLITGQVK